MNNEVRKPPREWRIYKLSKGQDKEDIINGPDTGLPEIHVREVLPGDDSLRSYDDVTCPFCNEKGFDLIGLKDHLRNYCEDYHEIKSIAEECIERESKGE